MTEIGEGVSVGPGPNSDGDDLDDNHWLELEYLYQSGAPVYGTFRATDSDGMLWIGRLNDQGKVCLAGLPAGTVEVDLLPESSTDDDIKATRQAIKRVLDQIIEDQKGEAAEYERDLENLGGPRRVYEHIHKLGATVWKHGVGVIELLGTAAHETILVSNFLHPLNLLGDNLKAGYKSYQNGELTREQWYDSVNQNLKDEHKKDVARIFGIEPDDLSEDRLKELTALITEAYDVAAFIADDTKTRDMLKQFVKELAETQHSMEWAGFAGAGVFELVLAALLVMFTGGAGLAAQAGTKLRHAAELRSLGPLFRKLAAQLRQKKLNKQVDVEVDQPATTKTDQPDIIDLKLREPNSRDGDRDSESKRHSQASPTPGDVRLAKSEGKTGAHVAAREKVARHYMENNGYSEDQISDALGSLDGKKDGGIDLNRPVEVSSFPPPEQMTQYVKSHGFPGNWFDPTSDSGPSELGINGSGRMKKHFEMPEGSGLTSYAKPVVDTWTEPDKPVSTSGGGKQLFINEETRQSVIKLNGLGE